MKSTLTCAVAWCSVFVMACASVTSAAELRPTNLRCEYREDPLGIEVESPRLSWVLDSSAPEERDQHQAAYHILVASTRDHLNNDQGDLWDTGKVESDATIQIPYAGTPLKSDQQVYWKLRVWNDKHASSDWSDPATWSAGLLSPAEWKAKWIGYDAPAEPFSTGPDDGALNFDGLKWVWTDEAPDATKDTPAGSRYFANKLSIPDGKKIREAYFLLAVDDKLNLLVNGHGAGEAYSSKKGMLLDVASLLHPGENTIAIEGINGRGPAGIVGRMMVWLEGSDQPLKLDLDKRWKVALKKPDGWEKGTFNSSTWPAAKEIGELSSKPWGAPMKNTLTLPPPPMLRKGFTIDKPIRRAIVHASALGLYELRLNGNRVGADYFTPGWTDYKKRVYYNTYDVTKMLRQGDNAVGAVLGDGWYAGYYAFDQRRQIYGKDPRLLVQLEVEFDDNSKQLVVTDESWKCAYGPWREGDLIMGAGYDATKEMPGWDAAGFDDGKWAAPVVAEAPKIVVQPYPGDPIRTHEQLPAKTVAEPKPGVYVFDLGQNMVGWVRLKIKADRGQMLTLRYSEMLQPDGMVYTIPLRGARATDHYVAKGDGAEEMWEPLFTSHGFRYVELTGVKERPSLDAITGIVAHADMPQTMSFECSSPEVNQLFHNIIWGQKGNYFEVPTDCPQRDERMGWTGDAQFFAPTAAYNFDVSAFFTKWLVDLITDAQYDDGSFADVAPDLTGGHGNVAWGDAGIVCPYVIYRQYGDTRIIEQHYDAMARYIEYLKKTSKNNIRGQGAYGDWVNLGGGAKSEVIGTAYFYYVTRLMSEMSQAIGKEQAASDYAELATKIRDAFMKNFVAEDGSIKESSQTGYALAFTMNLIPEAKRKLAAEKFVAEIEKKNWHLATGFIGTPRLLPALSMAGRNDVAYRLFLTDTFPSWLFQVKLGSTTMWERWDGWTPDKGFQDPAMNSFNHYAFGSVGQWMYRDVAGIDTNSPGFSKIVLRPQPGEGLTYVKAKYDSIRGQIVSAWQKEKDRTIYTFVVPPNTSATAYIPSTDVASMTESGKPVRNADGVKFMWTEEGRAVLKLQSGAYEFTTR